MSLRNSLSDEDTNTTIAITLTFGKCAKFEYVDQMTQVPPFHLNKGAGPDGV